MVMTKEKSLEFSNYPASKQLKKLAENPYDLTKKGNLSSERVAKYTADSCGYKLLYGTERVTDEVMLALLELAAQAKVFEKMEKMQGGEVCNRIEGFPSENRKVLHTATRDFFQPNPAPAAKEAANLAKAELDKLKTFMSKVDSENRFKDLIMIGIGGSNLGPQAHFLALQHLKKPGRNIHFICNVDPDETTMVLRQVDLKNTLVLVVSKSGTTLETAANEEFVKNSFKEAGLDPKKHFIAITGMGSPMDDKQKYLESFYIWDWIGGRFSTTSMVGGVLLAFAFGYDVFYEFLRGASSMDKAALSRDLNRNLPLLGALLGIWNRNFLNVATEALIPYTRALSRWSAHIQQASMESNGKHIDTHGKFVDFATGPIIWGEPGTNGQHSFFQLIHQGTDIIALEFIGYLENQCQKDIEIGGTFSQEKLLSNLFAQSISLATGEKNENPNKDFAGNRPSHILLGKQLTPHSLGVLLSYYENKIAFQGFVWGINSFDQEGVQLGKVLANRIIDCFAAKRGKPLKKHEPYPVADAYLKHLDHLENS